jgi:hypothetical protein
VLLKYPELLPYKDKNYLNYLGIWQDIKNYEWQKNIFYERFQNVDNVHILN